jgi:hypothetical protein
MRIKRAVIIPVILAFSAAGSVLAGSVVPAAAAQAPSAHAYHAAHPYYWYYWA